MTDHPDPTDAATAAFEEEGESPPPGSGLRGVRCIQHYLKTLDDSPGVYRMLDEKGQVLYVGKARNLRKRVASYTRASGHSARIGRMVAATASMMFLTTRTETEALLLEQNLIKQLKPRYNVLLRDDKSFPHILIARDHPFPRLAKHRGARRVKGDYFGPFASAGAVNRTLNQLQKAFRLRDCSDATFQGRTRPCLQYQIARCAGPCVGRISEEEYAKLVDDAVAFLRGRSSDLQARLARQMQEASARMEYERAAALRDRIQALTQVQASQGINPRTVAEADIVALHEQAGQACVQVFFIRAHQSWGNRAYYPRTGSGAEAAEILEAFLGQFYARRQAPRLILLSQPIENADLMEQALSAAAGHRVRLVVPKRGEKAELVENALRNARESLARRMAEGATQARLLQDLARAFDLPAPPRRIEVYDNSHIQGAHAVGAMIVAGPEGFDKAQYRRFNIRTDDASAPITPGDDFAMMKQVLTRRFKRLLKDDPDRDGPSWPDLLLIDGGAGQVAAVVGILQDMDIADIPVIGVAKGTDRDAGKELFHRPGRPPLALPRTSPVLYFIQRLRDEAHRFAIGSHRQKRSRAMQDSPLDSIPGVGPARKRALLAHFGSARAVARAGLSDLKAVDGISETLAETIHAFFQQSG